MAVFTANNLYPGTIDTAMPGFNVEDGQVKIYFNFSQYNDITKIKQNYIQVTLKYQNNNLNALNDASEIILKNWNQDDNGYYFILEDSDLKDEEFIPYQYYKLQFRLTDIAASDKTGSQTIDNWLSAASTISGKTNLDESSEWSTICLIRGIIALTLEVEGLTAGGNLQSVSNLDNVIGHVSFTAADNIENTEYLKAVKLKLYNKDNVLIKDSGEIICDNYKAPNYFNYSFDYKFQKGNENPYKMEIVCITNTLYQETFIYNFYITEENIDFDFSPNLTTITDSETGTIKLGVEYKDSGLADTLKIYRTAATDNYSEKKEIYSGPFVKASESSYEYVNGSGTSISLNNTMQSKMKMSLAPSELEQTTYTGKNLLNGSLVYQDQTLNGVTLKNNGDGSFTITGTATADFELTTNIISAADLTTKATKLPAGTYRQQFASRLQLYDENYNWVANTWSEFTTTQELYVRNAFFTISNGQTYNTTLWYQIEAGSTKTSYEPYVGGIASPNPEYPQDIHTISGNNSVVVEGKNLLNKDLIKKGKVTTNYGSPGVIPQENTDANRATLPPDNAIKVEPNTTYTINYNSSSIYFALAQLTKDKVSLGDTGWKEPSNLPFTITTEDSCKYIGFNFRKTDATSTITDEDFNDFINSNIQLEKGSTATTYTPYVSQTAPINLDTIEYCKIGNYEDEFIHNKGKNEIPFQDGEVTLNGITISVSGGIVKLNGTATATSVFKLTNGVTPINGATISNNWLNENVITNKNNNTFSINYVSGSGSLDGCAFRTYADTTTYLNQYYPTKTSQSTSYTTDGKISCIVFFFNLGASFDNYTFTLQLEKGISATDFEPTNDKWYLKKNIGKVVLDGSEGWSERTNAAGHKQFYCPSGSKPVLNAQQLCNYFSRYNSSTIWNYGGVGDFAIVALDRNFICVVKNDLILTDFKTSLASNNLEVYYVMATPTYTQITGTLETQLNNIYEKLLSYKGTTNVSQINNNLSFNITASALKDTSSLLVNPQYLDTSFESGILYKYEVKAVNTKDNLKSKEFETESPIGVMFDHMYLKSGNQQLKIKFNPQINSMKTIYSENKTDTLGSQYPFIKRNAAVKYRTFPISGLISYFMDGEHYFSSRSFEYGDNLNDYNTFNNNNQITSTRDYTYERLFRERVRNFLEDNKVKLFRSPTEGNMLVKLMDINFSPNQSTGRLIWNFSATAYEIDDMTIDNLKKYGIIPMDIDNNFGEDDYINDPALFSYMPHTSEEGSI